MIHYPLFVIGQIDFTRRILVPTYQVNRQPIYTSWKDGYGVTHRDITRFKMSGTFTLYFDSIADQLEFQELLRVSTTAGGYVDTMLYDNLSNKTYPAQVYLDIAPRNVLPLLGEAEHDGIAVKIEER